MVGKILKACKLERVKIVTVLTVMWVPSAGDSCAKTYFVLYSMLPLGGHCTTVCTEIGGCLQTISMIENTISWLK